MKSQYRSGYISRISFSADHRDSYDDMSKGVMSSRSYPNFRGFQNDPSSIEDSTVDAFANILIYLKNQYDQRSSDINDMQSMSPEVSPSNSESEFRSSREFDDDFEVSIRMSKSRSKESLEFEDEDVIDEEEIKEKKKAPNGSACEKHKKWKKRCPSNCPFRKSKKRKNVQGSSNNQRESKVQKIIQNENSIPNTSSINSILISETPEDLTPWNPWSINTPVDTNSKLSVNRYVPSNPVLVQAEMILSSSSDVSSPESSPNPYYIKERSSDDDTEFNQDFVFPLKKKTNSTRKYNSHACPYHKLLHARCPLNCQKRLQNKVDHLSTAFNLFV